MKLSDALRLADEMGLPDVRRKFIEIDVREWGGEKPPSCAIGGANIASGYATVEIIDGVVLAPLVVHTSHWFSAYAIYPCPACPKPRNFKHREMKERPTFSLDSLVIHLYDHHKWSRTQIAELMDRSFSSMMTGGGGQVIHMGEAS